MSNVERWVEKFREFGAQPSASRYVALFDPEGTVFDSGMERPLKVIEMALHNVVDRFELVDGRVIYGQAYFDTVVLLRLIDPSIDEVHFAPSAGVARKEQQ